MALHGPLFAKRGGPFNSTLAAEDSPQFPPNGCCRASEVHRGEGNGVLLDYRVFVKCHLDCRVQEQPGSLIRSETEALLRSHIGVHLIKVVTLETGAAKVADSKD